MQNTFSNRESICCSADSACFHACSPNGLDAIEIIFCTYVVVTVAGDNGTVNNLLNTDYTARLKLQGKENK
jgi:hypothetical protein